MKRIQIEPTWVLRDEDGQEVDRRLYALLTAVHEAGKLTVAAARVGLSYRHAWNLLGRWAVTFGQPLVILAQGKGAHLAPLGEKLVWTHARARARLLPELENITSELNLELDRAAAARGADDGSGDGGGAGGAGGGGTVAGNALRIHASYGYGVAKLPDLLRRESRIGLDLQYRSAADALASLARGDCDIAGFHVPEGPRGARAVAQYRAWLAPDEQKLLYLVRRQQGLYVAPGNPKAVRAMADLARRGVRFVNRQRGSGTRTLIDTLLEEARVDPATVQGYATEEYTHAAVAAYVASGMADAGIGVEPAARQFRLDFVPLAGEHYFLLCPRAALRDPRVVELRTLLRGAAYRALTAGIPGYRADRAGELLGLRAAFPWLEPAPRRRAGEADKRVTHRRRRARGRGQPGDRPTTPRS